MRKALIIGSNSSSSEFKNGGTIRQSTIVNFLQFEGFEVSYLGDIEAPGKTSWDVIVILSLRKIHCARKIKSTKSKIWLDLCDSWIYSRFSMSTGPRLFLIGLFECLTLIINRRDVSSFLVTYISTLDFELDKTLLRFLNIKNVRILTNNWGARKIRLNTSTSKRLVFLGNGNYFPNLLAVMELALVIGPALKRNKFMEPFQIFGSNWPKWIDFLPNIQLRGFKFEEDLYFTQDIHLAPLRQKAGIKNKIMIPLNLGLPVVAYLQSTNGISDVPNLYSCKSQQDFSFTLLEIFHNGSSQPEYVEENPSQNETDTSIVEWLHS